MSLASDIVKKFEGLRLDAYQDVGGIWTIGYGSIGRGVVAGTKWTQEQADAALEHYLEALEGVLDGLIDVPVTEGQRAALTSLAYNIGTAAFASSTLLKLLNAQDYDGAADQFLRWTRVKGRVVSGLVNRRSAERALFLGQ